MNPIHPTHPAALHRRAREPWLRAIEICAVVAYMAWPVVILGSLQPWMV